MQSFKDEGKIAIAEAFCSVCIATYRRPALLATLLESLLRQKLDDDTRVEIVVVDNDVEETARAVVERFQNSRFPIIYAVESRKNISYARNKGLALAQGDYILFIDDDETADEDWLATMLKTCLAYNADAVFGRVVSEFPTDTPEWIKSAYIFNRPTPPTGSEPQNLATANCLVKVSALKETATVFDERFGITGGEDSQLFKRLLQSNKKLVYAYEAKVTERIPTERTEKAWMLRRAYRTGNIYGRICIDLAQNKLLERFKNFSAALIRFLASIFLSLLFLPKPVQRWHWLLKTAANWGRMLSSFDVTIQGY